MNQLVRIVDCPFVPDMEVAGDIVIKLHAPCSPESVTVQVNPDTQEYIEKLEIGGVEARQFIVTKPTDETRELFFDFGENKIKEANIAGCNYRIELMSIGMETVQEQECRFYEFNVSTE